MFARTIAVLLVFILFTASASNNATESVAKALQDTSGNTIRDQVSQMQPGALIAIRFTDGSKARGYLSKVEADEFSFRVGDRTSGDERRTRFDAVKSVKVVKPTHTHPVAWIATGVILAAVVVAVVTVLVERHNEGG